MADMCQIQFPNTDVEEKGIAELMAIRDSLKIVQDGQYVITKKECQYLTTKNINHTIIAEF